MKLIRRTTSSFPRRKVEYTRSIFPSLWRGRGRHIFDRATGSRWTAFRPREQDARR